MNLLYIDELLTKELQIELKKRVDRYDRGEMEFKSWEEVKATTMSRFKNGL
jgi:hypothetical protein